MQFIVPGFILENINRNTYAPMEDQNTHHARYAVIPYEVLTDPALAPNDKIVYAFISNLSNQAGYCWASNHYLGEVAGISHKTIQDVLRRLEGAKHINRVMTPEGRKIFIAHTPGHSRQSGPTLPGIRDTPPGNPGPNNLSVINQSNITPPILSDRVPKKMNEEQKAFLYEYVPAFERLTGKTVKKQKTQIAKSAFASFKARLREGYTVAEITQALENACADEHHTQNGLKWITFDFILRPKKLEMHLTGPSAGEKTIKRNIFTETPTKA